MELNYKELGDLIHQVDVRNTGLKVTKLMGVNLSKKFMPSVANIIGTDLSKYKIVRKGQFACKLMSVGRDVRLPIAYKEDNEDIIISSAYYAFEINNPNEIISEYLMMHFSRSEFDRELWFYSGGDVRGGINWDTFCKIKVAVPPIDKQREIISAYKVIADRIELKEKINDNLMATAYAIYKKMFIENINKADLPKGWAVCALGDIAELIAGGDRPLVYSDFPTKNSSIPIFSNGIDKEGLYGFTDKAKIFEESVTVSARGTVGYVFLREEPYVPIVRLISVIPNPKYITAKYLYFALSLIDLHSTGTTQQQITVPDFKKRQVLVPSSPAMDDFMRKIEPLFTSIKQNKKEIQTLSVLQGSFLTILSC